MHIEASINRAVADAREAIISIESSGTPLGKGYLAPLYEVCLQCQLGIQHAAIIQWYLGPR